MKNTNADWKCIIEDRLADLYLEKLNAMSLAEIQRECERVGFDYTILFKND